MHRRHRGSQGPTRKAGTTTHKPRTLALPVDAVRTGPAPDAGHCEIFYKDAHLMLVDKGPGLLTVPPDAGSPPTVMGLLARRLKGAHGQVFAVHRLDRDTSGVLVVARTRSALDRLVDALARREFKRVYLALVLGTPPAAATLVGHLGTVGKDLRMRHVAEGAGQRAVTHMRVVEQGATAALVALKLDTGRRNQIRVQLAELGHPLLGESQYADTPAAHLKRQALHSHRLQLTHPVTGGLLRGLSPMAPDMLEAWHRMGGRHGAVLRDDFDVPGPGAVQLALGRGGVVSASPPRGSAAQDTASVAPVVGRQRNRRRPR